MRIELPYHALSGALRYLPPISVKLVDHRGFKPRLRECKSRVLSLTLTAQNWSLQKESNLHHGVPNTVRYHYATERLSFRTINYFVIRIPNHQKSILKNHRDSFCPTPIRTIRLLGSIVTLLNRISYSCYLVVVLGLEPRMYHCVGLQPIPFAARDKQPFKLAGKVGLEPTVGFLLTINSRPPATNSATYQ